MIDALPEPYWPVPIAVVAALIEDPLAAEAAAEAAEPAAGRWREAARDALSDPVLATAARRCFEAALDALPRLGAEALIPLVAGYAERFVARGRCPADENPPGDRLANPLGDPLANALGNPLGNPLGGRSGGPLGDPRRNDGREGTDHRGADRGAGPQLRADR
jgi:hypothetical protein